MPSKSTDSPTSSDPAVGAYGLTITGLATAGPTVGLVPVPSACRWPVVQLIRGLATPNRPASHALDEERAVILLIHGEYAELDRRQGTIAIYTRQAIDDHDLVHPYLASPAGVMAQWHGRLAFHAGGIVLHGGAWGLLGGKGAGKTTLLAALHARGHGVLADDLVILRYRTAYAGPRTLDLRPATAARLGTGEAFISVREGKRSRLLLPPVAAEMPFNGWVVLREGPRVEMAEISLSEKLRLLSEQLMMGIALPEPFLDSLTLPMWSLRRPKRWDSLPEAADRLVRTLSSIGAPAQGGGNRSSSSNPSS